MPDAPQFTIGQEYRRRDLHTKYGGQRQGGISTPQRIPLLMLFTGESGDQYGYSDGFQEDGTFWYTGEGQVGDMEMVRGNWVIRDHETQGKALHLFESTRTGWVRYLGDASYLGVHEATAPDRNGTLRRALVFELALNDREPEAVTIRMMTYLARHLMSYVAGHGVSPIRAEQSCRDRMGSVS